MMERVMMKKISMDMKHVFAFTVEFTKTFISFPSACSSRVFPSIPMPFLAKVLCTPP